MKASRKLVDFLSTVEPFDIWKRQYLNVFASEMKVLRMHAHTEALNPSLLTNSFVIVVSGTCRIYIEMEEKAQKILPTSSCHKTVVREERKRHRLVMSLNEGEFFGHSTILDFVPERKYRIVAMTDGEIVVAPRESFLKHVIGGSLQFFKEKAKDQAIWLDPKVIRKNDIVEEKWKKFKSKMVEDILLTYDQEKMPRLNKPSTYNKTGREYGREQTKNYFDWQEYVGSHDGLKLPESVTKVEVSEEISKEEYPTKQRPASAEQWLASEKSRQVCHSARPSVGSNRGSTPRRSCMSGSSPRSMKKQLFFRNDTKQF